MFVKPSQTQTHQQPFQMRLDKKNTPTFTTFKIRHHGHYLRDSQQKETNHKTTHNTTTGDHPSSGASQQVL